jgi:hypothetical protein
MKAVYEMVELNKASGYKMRFLAKRSIGSHFRHSR